MRFCYQLLVYSILSFQNQQYHTVKMSLRIQNTYSSPIMHGKTCFKSEKDVLAPINLPNCEETERIFNSKQQTCKLKEQNFCQKETERNYPRQKRNDTVYLTNNGSEIRQQRQNWTVNQQSPQRMEKMHEISSILEQNNLASAYYAFQQLRNIIAQYFHQPSNLKVYSKLALLEAIQILKCEMQKKAIDEDDRSFSKDSKCQVKQLLQQITSLRSQNARLRQKLQLLKQDGGFSDCNSILNNSISFHSYTSCTSESANTISDQSFDLRLEKQLVKPFITGKQSIQQSTLGLFTDSRDGHQVGLINSTTINCINSFVIISPNHQEVQTEEILNQFVKINVNNQILEDKYEELISFFIQNLKKLTRYLINAANLAFISKYDKLQKIKDFLQALIKFKSAQDLQEQQTLLKESMQFVNFIISNSSQIDAIITKEYSKLPFQIK